MALGTWFKLLQTEAIRGQLPGNSLLFIVNLFPALFGNWGLWWRPRDVCARAADRHTQRLTGVCAEQGPDLLLCPL